MTTLSYLAAHRDAKRRLAAGEQQVFCEHCRRWHWQTVGCPAAYATALMLVRRIESDISGGNNSTDKIVPRRFYRRLSDGAILTHLGQIVNAILEGDLDDNGNIGNN